MYTGGIYIYMTCGMQVRQGAYLGVRERVSGQVAVIIACKLKKTNKQNNTKKKQI